MIDGNSGAKRPILMKLAIPFCVKKCDFCTRDAIEGWDTKRMHAYMEALQKEILVNAEQFSDCEVTAIHLGGGIASNATGQDVSDTMRLIRQHYTVAEDAPITMRAAICNISGASMPFFKRAGVTRYDFEMMSLDPVSYFKLNKRDSLGDFPVICDHFLHSYTNDTLGLVLAVGYEGVRDIDFRRSVNDAARGRMSHLIVQRCEGDSVVSETEIDTQLASAREVLTSYGFAEYAPLRFAKPGYEDRYTLGRASGMETLAFGLGAKTRMDGAISTNTSDLATYLAASDDFSQITFSVEPVAV
ncbi:MAG: coproporphyrinogen III oxidase [Actinobacteria bacterium]|nr:coproporphyrinogen III oxidase [Actinomycetota bacterium]